VITDGVEKSMVAFAFPVTDTPLAMIESTIAKDLQKYFHARCEW
jgi:hypothetical protein